jgi:hypothetical protein
MNPYTDPGYDGPGPSTLELVQLACEEYLLPVWFFVILFAVFIYHVMVPERKKTRKR